MNKYPKRKPTRLKRYDYSKAGYYFVTICTYGRIEWFGKIIDNAMVLNDNGYFCKRYWGDLSNHYDNVICDEYVIMPNHIHGILIIDNNKREGRRPSPTYSYLLSDIIRGFKTFSANSINKTILASNKFKWQRSFHDHIIRNDKSLNNIREYIINNPATWEKDENNINIPVGTGL